MNGPTWADVATKARQIEKRDVTVGAQAYHCPFCERPGPKTRLAKSTGHRCTCGALFYTQQAVAVHFKERDECPN